MSYSGQSKMFRLLTSCPDLFIFLHSTNKLPYIWCLQVVSVLFPPIGLRCPGFTRHLHLKYISVLQSDVHPQIFQCRLCFQQCWKNAGTWFQWNPQLGRIQCLGFDVFLFELFYRLPNLFPLPLHFKQIILVKIDRMAFKLDIALFPCLL